MELAASGYSVSSWSKESSTEILRKAGKEKEDKNEKGKSTGTH